MTILSGVPASLSIGAGRLLCHLVTESQTYGPSTTIIFAGNKSSAAASLRSKKYISFAMGVMWHYALRVKLWLMLPFLKKCDHLVLIHFQEIGSRYCGLLIEGRTERVWVYVLDASFFCVRSYNHLPGEKTECLRCCGGEFKNAITNNCDPFPIHDNNSIPFLEILRREVSKGKVGLLVQNEAQATLIRQHFGCDALVKVIGLWTVDMGDMPHQERARNHNQRTPYDIVFHADAKDAKGYQWVLEIAECCPDLRFFFPFSRPTGRPSLENCVYGPIRWESGLRELVAECPLTMSPSLWSAPIEGALVKSILHAPRVALPRVSSAFSSEIPETLVTHLDNDPLRASVQIRQRMTLPPNDPHVVRNWIEGLRKNARMLERIRAEITS